MRSGPQGRCVIIWNHIWNDGDTHFDCLQLGCTSSLLGRTRARIGFTLTLRSGCRYTGNPVVFLTEQASTANLFWRLPNIILLRCFGAFNCLFVLARGIGLLLSTLRRLGYIRALAFRMLL